MPFGPSHNEALLLFRLPFFLSLVLVVCLLFGWRRFVALLGAALALFVYLVIGFSTLQNIGGAFMLLFSGWAAVFFLAIALFVSTRRSRERG